MKKFGALLMAVLLVVGATPSAFAAEQETVSEPYSIEFNDSTLDGATKISEETYEENGRLITVTKYCTVTGDIITDTFERSSMRTFSKNGTDTATRTRAVSYTHLDVYKRQEHGICKTMEKSL